MRLNGVYRRSSRAPGPAPSKVTPSSSIPYRYVGGRRFSAEMYSRGDRRLADGAAVSRAGSIASPRTKLFISEAAEPRRVVGGGYIAVEFAGIFHGLGRGGHAGLSRSSCFFAASTTIFARSGRRDAQARHRPPLRQTIDVSKGLVGPRATLTDGRQLEADRDVRDRRGPTRPARFGGGGDRARRRKRGTCGSVFEILGAEHLRDWGLHRPAELDAGGDRRGRAFAETVFNSNPTAVDYRMYRRRCSVSRASARSD